LQLRHANADDTFRLAEIEKLKAERDQLQAEINQKARDNEALSRTSAFFTKLHSERLTRIAEEIHTAKELLLGPASGIVTSAPVGEATLTSFIEGPSGFESILS